MESPALELERVRTALTAATTVPLSCWNRDELAHWLCGLQDVRAQVDGLLCVAAAEADTAAVASLDGVRTLRQLVAGRTRTNPADVGADLALGRWLRGFDIVAQALTAGRITRRHVQIFRDLDNPRSHAHLVVAQNYLVDAATNCSWEGFIEVCNRWLANADPDGELADDRVRNRRCSLKRQGDGALTGHFRLDTVAGDALKNAIEREALRLLRIDADPTNSEARHRNHNQRMADALVSLVSRGTIRADGTVGAPLLHLVVGLDILDEAICRAAAAEADEPPIGPDGRPLGADLGIDPDNPLRRCELVDGTPIHPKQVIGLLGVATLRRLVLGGDSEILDLGRGVRNFPRHLKEALLASSRGRCTEPGCDAPPSWLEADHIVPWNPSGRTATTNGQTRCGPSNRAKRDRIEPQHTPHTQPRGTEPPPGWRDTATR